MGDVLVVHDGSSKPGGATRVVLEAARTLDADMLVGWAHSEEWWQDHAPNDVDVLDIRTENSSLLDLKNGLKLRRNIDFAGYDTVMTSGPPSKFINPPADVRWGHYLHHPPLPAMWGSGPLSFIISFVDKVNQRDADVIIVNSRTTLERAREHYGAVSEEDFEVVHPPVDVDRFTPQEGDPTRIVMVGRLEDRKRPLVALRAMEHLPEYTLRLVGDGPLFDRVADEAGANVDVLGFLGDDELVEEVESAGIGLFLAEKEDFGITPIEYMAAGTPVVGVDEPHTNRQIDENVGSVTDPAPRRVADTIEAVHERAFDVEVLRREATNYDVAVFRDSIREVIGRA